MTTVGWCLVAGMKSYALWVKFVVESMWFLLRWKRRICIILAVHVKLQAWEICCKAGRSLGLSSIIDLAAEDGEKRMRKKYGTEASKTVNKLMLGELLRLCGIPNGKLSVFADRNLAENFEETLEENELTISHPTRSQHEWADVPVQSIDCRATNGQWVNWINEKFDRLRTNQDGKLERCTKEGFLISEESFDGKTWTSEKALAKRSCVECVDWLNWGFCRKGYNCPFKHS